MIVLGLAGQAGTGKDTVADYLVDRYGFVKFAFSDALYREVQQAFGLDSQGLLRDRREKELPQEALELARCGDAVFVAVACKLLAAEHPDTFFPLEGVRLSPRQALQWWGTEYRRARDPDYWVKKSDESMATLWEQFLYPEHRPQYFVNTTTRYPNEQAWIHKFTNGQVWHLRRDGIPAVHAHSSETPLPVLPGEREIWNNDTIERLYAGIQLLLTTQAKFVRVEPMLPMVPPEDDNSHSSRDVSE